jgi:transcriptional regulator with XRE-family HTH domain
VDGIEVLSVAERGSRVRVKAAQVPLPDGVDLRTVTRIEAVEREPGVSTLARIARGLGVEPAELWRGVS